MVISTLVITTECWYHGEINGREAEELLKVRGENDSYMVCTSTRSPGNYVLLVRFEMRYVTLSSSIETICSLLDKDHHLDR